MKLKNIVLGEVLVTQRLKCWIATSYEASSNSTCAFFVFFRVSSIGKGMNHFITFSNCLNSSSTVFLLGWHWY